MALRRGQGAAGAAALALAICVWRLGLGDPATDALEARLYDARMAARGAQGAPASVAVVAVDEQAVARIGGGAPMRRALAEAVRRLREAGAAAIAIDLLLVDSTSADADLAAVLGARADVVLAVAALPDLPEALARDVELERALRRSAFSVVLDRRGSSPETSEQRALVGPTAKLASVALLGHVNVARAPDRILRRLPLALETGDGVTLPAMPLAAARIALGAPGETLKLTRGEGVTLGDRFVPIDAQGATLIDHRGPAGTITRVSLGDLLSGVPPPGGVEGRAVFIGATAQSLGDVGATPLDPDSPGVESLAVVAAQIIEGRRLDDGPLASLATLAIAVAAAVAIRAAALVQAPGAAATASATVWTATALAVVAAFVAFGLVVDATAALGSATAVGALGWFSGRARAQGRARAEARARARLQPHVSPLLELLETLGRGADRPRPATIVFVDMIGSTAMAEKIGADAAGRRLAAVQRRIGAAAARRRGKVFEVIGDGALVAFGLGDEPGRAARDALDFLRELATPEDGAALRATAHCGSVVIADLGSAGRRRLSVVGDAVNVASRLQDVARARATPILASADVVAVGGGAPDFRPLAAARLPGRDEAIEVLALGRSPSA